MLRLIIASLVFTCGIFLDIWLDGKSISEQIYQKQLVSMRSCDEKERRTYIGSSGTHYLFKSFKRDEVNIFSAPGVLGAFLLNNYINSECYRTDRENPAVVFFLSPDLFVDPSKNYAMASLYRTLDHDLAVKYLGFPNPFIGYRKVLKYLSCVITVCEMVKSYPQQSRTLNEAQVLEKWERIASKELDYKYLDPILLFLQKNCNGRCLIILAPVYHKYFDKIDINRVFANIKNNYDRLEVVNYVEALAPEMIGDTPEHIAPDYAEEVSVRLDQYLERLLNEN